MKTEDTEAKQRILDAAVAVFAERGLDGATIRKVATRARVNSALLYYYFNNKEDLFVESVRSVITGLMGLLEHGRRPFSGARDRLSFLVSTIFDYGSGRPDRIRLMTTAVSWHSDLFGRALNAVIGKSLPFPLEVIADGIRAGELRPAAPIHVWWSIVGMCIFSFEIQKVANFAPKHIVRKTDFSLEKRADEIVDLLVGGLVVANYGAKEQRGGGEAKGDSKGL